MKNFQSVKEYSFCIIDENFWDISIFSVVNEFWRGGDSKRRPIHSAIEAIRNWGTCSTVWINHWIFQSEYDNRKREKKKTEKMANGVRVNRPEFWRVWRPRKPHWFAQNCTRLQLTKQCFLIIIYDSQLFGSEVRSWFAGPGHRRSATVASNYGTLWLTRIIFKQESPPVDNLFQFWTGLNDGEKLSRKMAAFRVLFTITWRRTKYDAISYPTPKERNENRIESNSNWNRSFNLKERRGGWMVKSDS